MARGFQAESQFIASIYPGELQPIKKFVGPSPETTSSRCTVFQLEPVKRGKKPCVIEVVDSFENVLNVAESTERGNKTWNSKLVPYEQVVRDLLHEWGGNVVDMPDGAGPGIIAIVGTVPSQKEIQTMIEMLTRFAEWQFQRAERLMLKNDFDNITQTMRDMCEWLGRERAWSNPEALVELQEREREKKEALTECPHCYGKVDARATKCPHCREKIKLAIAEPQTVGA